MLIRWTKSFKDCIKNVNDVEKDLNWAFFKHVTFLKDKHICMNYLVSNIYPHDLELKG